MPEAGNGGGLLYEDDGVSEDAPFSLLRFDLDCGETLTLDWAQEGGRDPVLETARVILPAGERRSLHVRGNETQNGDEVPL